jgi:hypothetical protein
VHGIIVSGERQHTSLRMTGPNSPQRLQSAHAGHGKIHYHDIGRELKVALTRRLTGFRLGDDRYVRQRLQQESKSRSDDGVIVDQ